MKRLFAALSASIALAAPAQALPPLVPHAAPIMVGTGGLPPATLARAEAAVRAASDRKGFFLLDPPSIPLAPVKACVGKANPRACLRPLLLQAPRGEPTVPIHLMVTFQAAPKGLVRMTCIGAGKVPKDASRQSVLIDLGKALSADPAVHAKPLEDASWCVFDAMNEHLL